MHPWNRELCETEDVVCGEDWHELARNLEPVLRMKQLPPPAATCATTCPRSSPSARSRTGAARSASRALLDRTIYEFLYHYWFRCEVEGIEHVPADGGALLVSNHSGALPPDATMILKAVKEEHAAPAAACT